MSHCGKQEDPNKGVGNYYFQLSTLETNLVDANTGNSLAASLMGEWVVENSADSQNRVFIGNIDAETAKAYFNEMIESLLQEYSNYFVGTNLLPDNGYIIYSFQLDSDATYSRGYASATIKITNDSVSLN